MLCYVIVNPVMDSVGDCNCVYVYVFCNIAGYLFVIHLTVRITHLIPHLRISKTRY